MNRTLAAAALAAAMLPAAAFSAVSAPATLLGKTYTLGCALDANDGEALKVRMMVKNTSGHIIKKGTAITIRFVYSYAPSYRPNGPKTMTVTAWRDVAPNASIGFDRQPRGARRCTASATIRIDINAAIKKKVATKKLP